MSTEDKDKPKAASQLAAGMRIEQGKTYMTSNIPHDEPPKERSVRLSNLGQRVRSGASRVRTVTVRVATPVAQGVAKKVVESYEDSIRKQAYLRGRQRGVERAAYRQGLQRGVGRRPSRPSQQGYGVGGYSLMGDLGSLSGESPQRASVTTTVRRGKGKRRSVTVTTVSPRAQPQRESILGGSIGGGESELLSFMESRSPAPRAKKAPVQEDPLGGLYL